MKTFRTSITLASLALTLLAVALTSHAGGFQNGGFESPVVSTGGHFISSGSTNITGWITGGPGMVSLVNGPASGAVNPVDGAQQISFNGGDTVPGATLSQMFDTIVGRTYTVSFYVGRLGSGETMSLLAQ